MANSSISATREQREVSKGASGQRIEIVTISWVADDTDGSVPTLSLVLDGFLVKAVTNPGATAPTDNYDIVLRDPADSALDAAASKLINRDTANTEQVYPVFTGGVTPLLLAGTYTLAITGNAVNSATGTIVLYLTEDC